MMFHYKSMVGSSYNHCFVHQWSVLKGAFRNVQNLGAVVFMDFDYVSLQKYGQFIIYYYLFAQEHSYNTFLMLKYILHSSQVMLWGLNRAERQPCSCQNYMTFLILLLAILNGVEFFL